MPLSEHEQRMLDQIERALYAEDPRFAHAVKATDPHVHYKKRVLKAALGFLVGVSLLMAGVVSKIIPVGVVGFVVMLACCMWGFSSWKRISSGAGGDVPARGPRQPRASRPGFMERIEARWRRRREGP
ncbi:MAG: DUF3040 domain-containing protein [Streptosporangiales bacterium]|nr:DUF3040 domain-containing protein [Streptosporangiales bacterium]